MRGDARFTGQQRFQKHSPDRWTGGIMPADMYVGPEHTNSRYATDMQHPSYTIQALGRHDDSIVAQGAVVETLHLHLVPRVTFPCQYLGKLSHTVRCPR